MIKFSHHSRVLGSLEALEYLCARRALPSIHTLLQTATCPIQTPHVELSGPEGAQNPALADTRGTPRATGGRAARRAGHHRLRNIPISGRFQNKGKSRIKIGKISRELFRKKD
jgi:hypothetical protein